jgi:TusA-related sulfurtransferase
MTMAHKLDLRGVDYPMDYVSAHLLLSQLAPGCRARLIFGDDDAVVNVPRTLGEDGHEIVHVERWGRNWVVDVRSGQRAPVT